MKKILMIQLVAVLCLFSLSACEDTNTSSTSLPVLPSPSSSLGTPNDSAETSGAPVPETSTDSITPSSSGIQPTTTGEESLGDFVGAVTAVAAEGFTCKGSKPEVSEDGGYATVTSNQSINVIYGADVKFTICLYHTSDDTSEIVPATKDAVMEGKTVTLWGSLNGETFTATAVQVLEPVS